MHTLLTINTLFIMFWKQELQKEENKFLHPQILLNAKTSAMHHMAYAHVYVCVSTYNTQPQTLHNASTEEE